MFNEHGRQHRDSYRPRAERVIKAGFFAALALGVLAAGACHESGPRQTNTAAWEWRGQLAAPGQVNIRNTMGTINVEPSADDQVHVIAATEWSKGDWRKDLDFEVVSTGNTVTICAVWSRGKCSADDYNSRVRRGSSHSDVRAMLTVQVPAGVRVDAWTVSGDVAVRAAAPVKARTIDGDIKVGTSVGPVDAETVNGDVDIRMTTLADLGPVRAVTKNGDVAAWVPEITDGRIEAATMNGRIGSDFGGLDEAGAGDRRSFATSVGTGAREYAVQTLNGSAWLRLINADGSVAGGGSTTSNRARAEAISLLHEPRQARPASKNPR